MFSIARWHSDLLRLLGAVVLVFPFLSLISSYSHRSFKGVRKLGKEDSDAKVLTHIAEMIARTQEYFRRSITDHVRLRATRAKSLHVSDFCDPLCCSP